MRERDLGLSEFRDHPQARREYIYIYHVGAELISWVGAMILLWQDAKVAARVVTSSSG